MNVLKWASYDSDFKPNTLDMRFRLWAKKWITAYCSIIDKGQLLDFNSLKEKFNLDSKDFFRYLQLRQHFCQKIKKRTDEDLNKSALVKILSSAYKAEPMLKTITKLYKALMDLHGDSSLYIKERWEKESGIAISTEDWENICKLQWATSRSSYWREFCWRNTIRFFLTPKQKNKFLGNSNCWRLCSSQDANHFHIFWGCPNIRRFWKDIHNVLEKILDISVDFSFEVLYMGKVSMVSWERKNKYMYRIILASSKKAITRCWYKPNPPQIQDWIDIVKCIFIMEKITFCINNQKYMFVDFWSKWIEFITPIEPNVFLL